MPIPGLEVVIPELRIPILAEFAEKLLKFFDNSQNY
jgi:hypothetical protein